MSGRIEFLEMNCDKGPVPIRIVFEGVVSEGLCRRIQGFCRELKRERIFGVLEWVPCYNTVTVYYDPGKITHQRLLEKLTAIKKNGAKLMQVISKTIVFVPILYGGEFGPDLSRVAACHQLPEKEVIHRHQKKDYLIHMMGFLPGFPYLGGLDASIATPRLASPRMHVAKGSVGIAAAQTGIYPMDSPGGWNIIGHTPLTPFDPTSDDIFLFQPGDYVRFIPVTEAEYQSIEKEIKEERYIVKKEVVPYDETD